MHSSTSTNQAPHHALVIPLMLLYVVVVILVSTALQLFVVQRVCDERFGGQQCNSNAVTAAAARWTLVQGLVSSALSILVAGALGVLSDSKGRRLAVLPPVIATACCNVLLFCVSWYGLALWWTVVASAISGLGGSSATLFLGAFAYTADLSVSAQRAVHFAALEATLYAGVTIGSAGVGPLVTYAGGYNMLFFVSALAAFLALSLAQVLPESLALNAPARKLPVAWARVNIFGSLATVFRPSLWGSPVVLVGLAVGLTMAYSAMIGFGTVVVYIAKVRYGWGAMEISLFLASDWLLRTVSVLVLAPALLHWPIGERVRAGGTIRLMFGVIMIGLSMDLAAYCVYSVAPSTGWMFLGAALDGLSALAFPMIRASFSLANAAECQGAALAVISACETISNVAAPALAAGLYSVTSERCLSCVIYVFIGMLVVGLSSVLLAWRAVLRHARDKGLVCVDDLLSGGAGAGASASCCKPAPS